LGRGLRNAASGRENVKAFKEPQKKTKKDPARGGGNLFGKIRQTATWEPEKRGGVTAENAQPGAHRVSQIDKGGGGDRRGASWEGGGPVRQGRGEKGLRTASPLSTFPVVLQRGEGKKKLARGLADQEGGEKWLGAEKKG